MANPTVAIIGAGKVGSALALLLQEKGYVIQSIASKSNLSALQLAQATKARVCQTPAEAVTGVQMVLITTPDGAIASVCEEIDQKKGFAPGQIVVHTSGAYPSSILMGVEKAGAFPLSLHPLQSFANVSNACSVLPGSYFALEGHPAALPLGKKLVADLDGKAFCIKAKDKALYHTAACVASNYLVSLIDFATSLYSNFDLSQEEAFQALYPLLQGTLQNIAQVGIQKALTGPIVRGDVQTVQTHLKALAPLGLAEQHVYQTLGLRTVRIAQKRGAITNMQANELLRILNEEDHDGTDNHSLF